MLVIDGRQVSLTEAWCSLFAGRLSVGFVFDGLVCGIDDLPMPIDDRVDFSSLSGCSLSVADCGTVSEGNSSRKPTWSVESEFRYLRSVDVDEVAYAAETNLLSVRLSLVTDTYDFMGEQDHLAPVVVHGEITAECLPVERMTVLNTIGAFPVRFAKHYLPLIGIPGIPTITSREEIVSQFGEPAAEGGGYQSGTVWVPAWVRYTFDHCYLHFRFNADVVTEVTIMSRSGPFAADFGSD